jgi:8-oxo-dGTP pyrophosphatase MutT (NUDIX family)
VRARFAAHPAGLRRSDAAVEAAVRGDHSLSAGPPPAPRLLTKAAVLVPLIDRPKEFTVLLTRRTPHLAAHAGQVSFPGGRVEPADRDSIAAALRESEEEVGLPPDHVEVIGRLDTYITGTGFEIYPVVGLVRAPVSLRPDPVEVAEAFEVPLSFILDPANRQRQTRELRGHLRTFFVLPYDRHYIWGATAAMLVNLAEILTA